MRYIFIALIAKTKIEKFTKIFLAIIINFIYYRHSVLNVCLTLFEPDAAHSVFFYLSLRKLNQFLLLQHISNVYFPLPVLFKIHAKNKSVL